MPLKFDMGEGLGLMSALVVRLLCGIVVGSSSTDAGGGRRRDGEVVGRSK